MEAETSKKETLETESFVAETSEMEGLETETLEVEAETSKMETLEAEIFVAESSESSEMEAEIEILELEALETETLEVEAETLKMETLEDGDGNLGVRDLKVDFLSWILTPSLSWSSFCFLLPLSLSLPLILSPT